MPIYEYSCKSCHRIFEEWSKQVVNADAVAACPYCGGQGHKIMSQTSFALKGEGWYVTEYGSKKKDTAQKVESSSAQNDSATSGTAEQSPVAKEEKTPSASPSTAPAPAPSTSVNAQTTNTSKAE